MAVKDFGRLRIIGLQNIKAKKFALQGVVF
jgi:hypothetical protein